MTVPAAHAAPGYLFLAPTFGATSDGAAIYDDRGSPVWMHPPKGTTRVEAFQASTFHDVPVLIWWEGTVSSVGLGAGQFVIADATYTEIARFGAGNGFDGDLHEFLLTPIGTAYIIAGRAVPLAAPIIVAPPPTPSPAPGASLSSNLSPNASPYEVTTVWEGIVQEIDVATRNVLFEWHSLDHIDVGESYEPYPKNAGQAFDYLHLNSVDLDTDGNLLLSARHTSTIYKIDRTSGQVMWRLGGRKTDIAVAADAAFSWQHDARREADGTLSLFDDDLAPNQSRGLVLDVDETGMTASLVRAYPHPGGIRSISQGSCQILPNGDMVVGWGSQPNVSEFDARGSLVFDAQLAAGGSSYRALRFPWVGHPADDPAIALDLRQPGSVTAYVSWNGATEVTTWELLGGRDADTMTPLATTPRTGFETAIAIPSTPGAVAVRARDASGAVLGTSPVVTTSS